MFHVLASLRVAHIDSDGLIRVGEEIPPGSILVNKQSPVNQLDRLTGPDPTLPDEGMSDEYC